jgi:hypothetical protein
VLHEALSRFLVRDIAAALQWQRARRDGRLGGAVLLVPRLRCV